MNPSEISSFSICSHPKKLQSFFFFFFIIFTSVASSFSYSRFSKQAISYSDHCGSYVPEAIPTDGISTRYPFLEPVTSHYTGGERILGESPSQRSILFAATHNLFKTNINDTYKIQARMSFSSSNMNYRPTNLSYYGGSRSNYSRIARRYRPLVFLLDGFWSVSSNKMCMVGSARWYSKEGNPIKLEAVLKLKFARFITLVTSLVSGVMESLVSPDDSSYFEPISILGFPQVAPFKYNYTLVSDEGCKPGVDSPRGSSISMQSMDICSIFANQFMIYQLKYPSNCSSAQDCMPFGQAKGYLPPFVSLYAIQCSPFSKELRFLVEFQDRRFTRYNEAFKPNVTLIGEGTWSGKKEELCIVACYILNQSDPLGSAHIGDCSIRLTLWYLAVRSIKNTHDVEGQIWTTKKANETGYFETIKFQSFDHSYMNYGLKYEFTQTEKVRRSCPVKKPAKRKGVKYPIGYYQEDMAFDMSVGNKKTASFGSAVPISVGHQFYNFHSPMVSNWQPVTAPTAASYNGPLNISYQVNISYENGPLNISYEISFRPIPSDGVSSLNLSSTNNGMVEISAEGVYDGETGHLCMIGCRNLQSFGKNLSDNSLDCEILVKFQLLGSSSEENRNFIKGTIESMREKGDVLFFERLDIVSLTYSKSIARKSIWIMDLEIIMVLISDTLACVFIGRQLLHVKKHPELVPFVSVLMMLILTLGHMVPLLLNFEALFLNLQSRANVQVGSSGGWLELNEVVVRIVTMVAFLLQFRLLQLTWTAKVGNENGNEKSHWAPEIKTFVLSLPIYIVGGSAALLVNWKNDYYDGSQRSIWGDLRSYAGLTLDGFLFPQLILNFFQFFKGTALSHSFYIGTTFVRLLPHAYDLYRGPKSIRHQFDRFYVFANPRADFYSASWDIVIVCGGIASAVIIFLQQRFGGRFMFPKRFRGPAEYEMVPVASSE